MAGETPAPQNFSPTYYFSKEPLAKCSRRLQPALAQAGKPVPPGINLETKKNLQPLNEFCKRLQTY
jgi:hypothetical protein